MTESPKPSSKKDKDPAEKKKSKKAASSSDDSSEDEKEKEKASPKKKAKLSSTGMHKRILIRGGENLGFPLNLTHGHMDGHY